MKLSAAIELMLLSGKYNLYEQFMCCVLKDSDLEKHVEAVQGMVESIEPTLSRGSPLYCALYVRNVLGIVDMNHRQEFKVTQELYVWWVFDLKRKGL